MTSWTAVIEWNEDLSGRDGIDRFMVILQQDLGSLRADFTTGTVTVVVTEVAATLPQAMRRALERVEDVAGRRATLRGIGATEVYRHTISSTRPRRRIRARASATSRWDPPT